MRDQQVNTFGKGMMKDLSSTTPQAGSYVDAQNIRIISDGSGGENASGIVIDVKGNEKVLEVTPTSFISTPDWYTFWMSTGGLALTDTADLINSGYTTMVQGVVVDGAITYIWPDATYLLVQQDADIKLFLNTSGGDIILSAEGLGYSGGLFSSAVQYLELLISISPDDIEFVFQIDPAALSFYEVISASTAIYSTEILGHTVIRDILVLFVILSFGTSTEDLAEYGAILKCDLSVTVPLTSDVVYISEALNFDRDYPIEAIGRYESSTIQRVYWTDNLNPVRTLNIVEEGVSDLGTEQLNITPPASLKTIAIKSVSTGGKLPEGSYQYTYRLSKSSGTTSRFAPLSSPLHVVDGSLYWSYDADPESTLEYSGREGGADTNKKVSISASNIDPTYDDIEVAVVYRKDVNSVESAYLLDKKAVPSSGEVSMVHRSDSGTPITIEEITSFSGAIAAAKTIETKDNRMFLGNTLEKDNDFIFNARAYRYKRDDDVLHPWESAAEGEVSTYASNPEGIEIPTESEDNPYNSIGKDDVASDHYKFKKDGVTLGGEGVYVSYKFIKKKLDGNTFFNIPAKAPFVTSSFKGEEGECGDTEEGSLGDYKSPINASKYVGYNRGEVYRFGIVLFDLQGDPGYVNWIADIKFPDHQDYDVEGGEGIYNYTIAQATGTSSSSTDSGTNYNLSTGTPNVYTDMGSPGESGEYTHTTSKYVESLDAAGAPVHRAGGSIYALGVEFSIDLPKNLAGKISGYSVVRAPRGEGDKTVLGSGILNFMAQITTDDETFVGFYDDLVYRELGYSESPNTGAVLNSNFIMTLDSPDFPFQDDYPSGGLGCDTYLKVVGALGGRKQINFDNPDELEGPYNYGEVYAHHKLADAEEDLFKTYQLLYVNKIVEGGALPTNPIKASDIPENIMHAYNDTDDYDFKGFNNKIYSLSQDGDDVFFKYRSIGADTLLCIVELGEDSAGVGIDWERWIPKYPNAPFTYIQGRDSKLLGVIKRNLGYLQYGGSAPKALSFGTYISTGHYSSVGDSKISPVWGGDTYVTIYDMSKTRRHDADLDAGEGDGDSRSSSVFAFPVETTFNTTLRSGYHFANKTDFSVEDGGAIQTLDEFILSATGSPTNGVTVFIPKPEGPSTPLRVDNRIAYSELKVNSTTVDGWRRFKLESYKDAEGSYGGITKLVVHKNTLLALQERGVGAISVSPVSTVVDSNDTSIVLGVGDVIQDVRYISTTVGVQDVRSVTSTTKGIYWIDTKTKKAYAFRANGLDSISDTHGMKAWFASAVNKDSVITLGNDVINDEVLFSVDDTTLAFSEVLNKFTSFYPYGTSMYINTYNRLFSVENTTGASIYEHNIGDSSTFFDVKTDSYIEFLVNKHPIHTKVFDIIEWYTASTTNKFDSAVFSNNVDASVTNDLSESSSKERMTRMPVPRTAESVRFRDVYMKVKLTTSQEFTLHYVKTTFRISKR